MTVFHTVGLGFLKEICVASPISFSGVQSLTFNGVCGGFVFNCGFRGLDT